MEEKLVEKVTATSYTLYKEDGSWLGQVVLTSDGMFSAVTDYGNFSYAWRASSREFKKFILTLDTSYFGAKMAEGMAYVTHTLNVRIACDRFAEKILPALQEAIKAETPQEDLFERIANCIQTARNEY